MRQVYCIVSFGEHDSYGKTVSASFAYLAGRPDTRSTIADTLLNGNAQKIIQWHWPQQSATYRDGKTWKKIRYAGRLTQRKSEWRKRTDQPLFIPLYSYCFPKCRATLSALAFFRSWLRVFDKGAVVLWMRSCGIMPCLITSEGTRPSVPVLILARVLL